MINNLTPGQLYKFKVSASNLYGTGAFSNELSQYTIIAPDPMSPPVLARNSSSDTLIKITWIKPNYYTS